VDATYVYDRRIKKSMLLPLVASVLLLTGCGGKTLISAKPSFNEKNTIEIVHDSAAGIGYVLKQESKNPEKVCRTTSPDFVSGKADQLNLAGPLASNIGASDAFEAVTLGGRSPTVLIVREMMYRACELSLNVNANLDQSLSIYKALLDETVKVVNAAPKITGTQSSSLNAPIVNMPNATPVAPTSPATPAVSFSQPIGNPPTAGAFPQLSLPNAAQQPSGPP